MTEIASPQTKYRGQKLPPDSPFSIFAAAADDQYAVRPAPIAPLMAKPNCFLSTHFPPPPLQICDRQTFHLSILSFCLAQQVPYQISPSRQCTCTRTRRRGRLCLSVEPTPHSPCEGCLALTVPSGRDQTARRRHCPLVMILLATKSQTGASKLTRAVVEVPKISRLIGSLLPTIPCQAQTIR